MSAALILELLGLICFVLATIGIASRANLVAAGLAFVTLAVMLGRLGIP